MLKSSSFKNLTPPLRSVVGEASQSDSSNVLTITSTIQPMTDLKLSNEKTCEHHSRSSSSSHSISGSSSFSESTLSLNRHGNNEDDLSSNDDTNAQWSELEQRFNTLRRLTPEISFELSNERIIPELSILECQVCLNQCEMRPLSCCSSNICPLCVFLHLSSHINEACIRIHCPSCSHIFSREEIIASLANNENSGELIERYKRFYADINGERHIKTCPQCCFIKEVDKKLFEGTRWRKNAPRRVVCDECQFVWCFLCHAPWHEKMNCKEYQEGEKLLQAWAAQKDRHQQNAQRCPRCKIFISRSGGCPHMICSKCHCDFCYNCGKRRLSIKFIASHESRFLPFGCKYNLYPDKPILRHTVRGLVAGAATLAAPVAAVGAVALLAVGTTIGAPTYGTYLLVKHIRKKRRNRHHRDRSSMTNDGSETNSNNREEDDDDDLARAIQASNETFREEMNKREERLNTNWTKDDDDDDDDSFDD